MKRQVFTLTLLLLGTLLCHAQYSVLNGDLNHDGKISIFWQDLRVVSL